MRISLVQAPVWGTETPPLGLAQVAAILLEDKNEVKIFDFNIDFQNEINDQNFSLAVEDFWCDLKKTKRVIKEHQYKVKSWVEEIKRFNPELIGFSIQNSSVNFSLELINKIKKILPKVTIFCGGSECKKVHSGLPLIKNNNIDYVFTGEIDNLLLKFIKLIESKSQVQLPGVLSKSNNEIINLPEVNRQDSLDLLLTPDFSLFKLKAYSNQNTLPIYSSRGCVNSCVYCTEKLMVDSFRFKTGTKLFEEISTYIKKYPQVTSFSFQDSLINGAPRELELFCDLIIKNKINISWFGQACIKEYMTPELTKKMQKAGCSCISYGIESGSNKILKLMNKPFTVEIAKKVIKNTYNAGILVVINFIFGFPGETQKEFQESLDFLKEMAQYIDTVNPSIACCAIGINTYLYNNAKKYNVDLTRGNLFWNTNDNQNNYPLRLERHKRFSRLATSLGIKKNIDFFEDDYERLLNTYYSGIF